MAAVCRRLREQIRGLVEGLEGWTIGKTSAPISFFRDAQGHVCLITCRYCRTRPYTRRGSRTLAHRGLGCLSRAGDARSLPGREGRSRSRSCSRATCSCCPARPRASAWLLSKPWPAAFPWWPPMWAAFRRSWWMARRVSWPRPAMSLDGQTRATPAHRPGASAAPVARGAPRGRNAISPGTGGRSLRGRLPAGARGMSTLRR